jgi:hypothetical protein
MNREKLVVIQSPLHPARACNAKIEIFADSSSSNADWSAQQADWSALIRGCDIPAIIPRLSRSATL